VRELQRLERKVRSETAQARTSSVYMALAPPVILVMNYFIDPVHTRMLFTEVPGQMILCAAAILNLLAYLWARLILNPEI
jgi:Flp pilus assembly protein TadB